jgi:hypothetical protein
MAVVTAMDAALEVAKLQQHSIRLLKETCLSLHARCEALERRVKALEDGRR